MFIYKETEYPRFIGDIQLMHPNWQEGQPLPKDWAEVIQEELPEVAEGNVIEQLAVVKEGGVWVQKWATRPLTEAELEANSTRSRAVAELQAKGMSLEDAHKFVAQFIG
jgi:hypothetical protein